MPNTTSQPTSSSERTSDCAPVIGTASKRRAGAAAEAPVGPGRLGGGAGLGPGGPGTGPGRGEAVVMGSSAHLRVSEHEKTPDRRRAERGWRVDVRAHSGVDGPGKYEDEDGGHGPTVAGRTAGPSNRWDAGSTSWAVGGLRDTRPGEAGSWPTGRAGPDMVSRDALGERMKQQYELRALP